MIVEINNTDNEYFEKAILFLNPHKENARCSEITANASELLSSAADNIPEKKINEKRKILPTILMIALSSISGSAITIAIMILTNII